jgi:hypothetical protein
VCRPCTAAAVIVKRTDPTARRCVGLATDASDVLTIALALQAAGARRHKGGE